MTLIDGVRGLITAFAELGITEDNIEIQVPPAELEVLAEALARETNDAVPAAAKGRIECLEIDGVRIVVGPYRGPLPPLE
jgi:hypothetical protein